METDILDTSAVRGRVSRCLLTRFHARAQRSRTKICRLHWLVLGPLASCALAGPAADPEQTAPAASLAAEEYLADFDTLWAYVQDHYAYLDQKRTDWESVRAEYRPRAARTTSRRDFVVLLEEVLGELYDPHAHLAVNTATSPRMIPTDTDLGAEWRGGRAVITDVRAGSGAEQAGIRSGMEVVAVGGAPVGEVVRERLPSTLRSRDPAAEDWALQAALAGRRDQPVRLDLIVGSERRSFEFVPGRIRYPDPLLTASVDDDTIGHIRIHNSLGATELIAAFDSALAELSQTRCLVLDLRETPSGGNTTVARGIMGRFVTEEMPYQRHELPAEERELGVRRLWTEYVAPRGPFTYRAPVVVLVGRWTGSMGEGLAIGLNAIRDAPVIGSRMAGLLGAVYEVTLPNTGFVARIPTERLFHVDGRPREEFVPRAVVEGPCAPPPDESTDGNPPGIRQYRSTTG